MTTVLSADTCCTTAIAKVSGADLQVPLVQGGECSYANFDYAASAPALAKVTDRIAELLPTYASVHRGAGYASRISTLTAVAPASRLFSTSSLIAAAGRSTTSPAAIFPIIASLSNLIFPID